MNLCGGATFTEHLSTEVRTPLSRAHSPSRLHTLTYTHTCTDMRACALTPLPPHIKDKRRRHPRELNNTTVSPAVGGRGGTQTQAGLMTGSSVLTTLWFSISCLGFIPHQSVASEMLPLHTFKYYMKFYSSSYSCLWSSFIKRTQRLTQEALGGAEGSDGLGLWFSLYPRIVSKSLDCPHLLRSESTDWLSWLPFHFRQTRPWPLPCQTRQGVSSPSEGSQCWNCIWDRCVHKEFWGD